MASPRIIRVAGAVAVAVAPLLLSAVWAGPAAAHGALTNPASRAAVCGLTSPGAAACRAAVAASGGQPFADWDNLRVAGVDGRDRQVIPDGKLCSGGLTRYRGLDLPRADWPATKLRAGARFSFSYRETIPHRGSFRLYVTKDGYDPTRALRWSDLETTPFLTVTDPPIQDKAYVFSGALPRAKTGRHLIYTIWQNSSTDDTYYSCSDVVFSPPSSPTAARAAASAAAKPKATAAPSPRAASPTRSPAASAVARLGPAQPLSATGREDSGSGPALPLLFGGLAVLAVAGAVVAAVHTRRRRL